MKYLSTVWKVLANFGLPALCLLFVWWMYRSYYITNPPLDVPGAINYGENSPGQFQTFAWFTLAELLVTYAVLRPWSYRLTSWWRPIAVLVLLFPWLCLIAMGAMHSSQVYGLHLLWLMLLNLILFILTLVTFVAWLVKRQNKLP